MENDFKSRGFMTRLQNLPDSKKKVIFFAVMGVIVLVMVFIGLLLTKKGLSNIGQSLKNVNLPKIESPNRNEVALNLGINDLDFEKLGKSLENLSTEDWETYENSTYAYSIKHPENWYIDTKYSENDFIKRGSIEDSDFIGGDTTFSNYPNADTYSKENLPPEDIFNISLMVYKVDSITTYDQFITAKYSEGGEKDQKESIDINGIQGIRLIGVTTENPTGVTVVITLIKVDENMFVFNYSGNPIQKDNKYTADLIISTFKITE